ncbi:ATP-binding cassette domain-containing protein [Actinomadura chokoriensis]|uniref:ATP-binding cassette domain-containing protein n=2 Tax=Actinomadura chokoriensis TaxID=454156 RepID=A0ABV4QRK0_9ACTN
MGPSGSGRSTLLYCLSGIAKPDDGDVTFREAPVSFRTPDAPSCDGRASASSSSSPDCCPNWRRRRTPRCP